MLASTWAEEFECLDAIDEEDRISTIMPKRIRGSAGMTITLFSLAAVVDFFGYGIEALTDTEGPPRKGPA